MATRSKQQIHHLHRYLIQYICEEKIKTELQLLGKTSNDEKDDYLFLFSLLAAIDYLLTNPVEPIDRKALEESAGIGVVVTPEEIERVVENVLQQNKTQLLEQRYDFPTGTLLGEVRKRLKWADGKMVKSEMDVQVNQSIEILDHLIDSSSFSQLLDLLGPNDRSTKSATPKQNVSSIFSQEFVIDC